MQLVPTFIARKPISRAFGSSCQPFAANRAVFHPKHPTTFRNDDGRLEKGAVFFLSTERGVFANVMAGGKMRGSSRTHQPVQMGNMTSKVISVAAQKLAANTA